MAVTLFVVVIVAIPLVYLISKTLRLELEIRDLRQDLMKTKKLLEQLYRESQEMLKIFAAFRIKFLILGMKMFYTKNHSTFFLYYNF